MDTELVVFFPTWILKSMKMGTKGRTEFLYTEEILTQG